MSPAHLQQIGKISGNSPFFFSLSRDDWEGVRPVFFQNKLYGYAWVTTDKFWDQQQQFAMLRYTAIFGVIWIVLALHLIPMPALSVQG